MPTLAEYSQSLGVQEDGVPDVAHRTGLHPPWAIVHASFKVNNHYLTAYVARDLIPSCDNHRIPDGLFLII
jgi:hypothetical protein